MTEEKEQHILWVDTETTGFDAINGHILEIACVLTSKDLTQELGSFESLVLPATLAYDITMLRKGWHEDVIKMHTINGLWRDLEAIPGDQRRFYNTPNIESALIAWLSEVLPENSEKPVLGGSSVYFDRKFCIQKFQKFSKQFHYRDFDVSTLKRACEWWDILQFQKEDPAHRAMADIRNSIQTARQIQHAFQSTKGPLIREVDGKLEVVIGLEIHTVEPNEGETLADCYPAARKLVEEWRHINSL